MNNSITIDKNGQTVHIPIGNAEVLSECMIKQISFPNNFAKRRFLVRLKQSGLTYKTLSENISIVSEQRILTIAIQNGATEFFTNIYEGRR